MPLFQGRNEIFDGGAAAFADNVADEQQIQNNSSHFPKLSDEKSSNSPRKPIFSTIFIEKYGKRVIFPHIYEAIYQRNRFSANEKRRKMDENMA